MVPDRYIFVDYLILSSHFNSQSVIKRAKTPESGKNLLDLKIWLTRASNMRISLNMLILLNLRR